MKLTIAHQIAVFIEKHDRVPNGAENSKPLWIHVRWEDCDDDLPVVERARYDFKNDDARRAFGILCHNIYTSSEDWSIFTRKV